MPVQNLIKHHMATKTQAVINPAIEAHLRALGFIGTAVAKDHSMDIRATEDLKNYQILQYQDGVIRAKQLDGFFWYTPKTSK